MLPLLLQLLAATAAAAAAATADAIAAATACDDTLVAPWASGTLVVAQTKLYKHGHPWVQAGQAETCSPAIPLSARPQHPLPPAWLPLASPCVHGFRLLALGTQGFSDTLPKLPRFPAACGPLVCGPNCKCHTESLNKHGEHLATWR